MKYLKAIIALALLTFSVNTQDANNGNNLNQGNGEQVAEANRHENYGGGCYSKTQTITSTVISTGTITATIQPIDCPSPCVPGTVTETETMLSTNTITATVQPYGCSYRNPYY